MTVVANGPEITVHDFVEHTLEPLALEVVSGVTGMQRKLRSSRIQKPGLALAGYAAFLHEDRVQVLGQTELSYLDTLDEDGRDRAVQTLLSVRVACILVTKGLEIPRRLLEQCESTGTPLLRTPLSSGECIRKMLAYLDDLLMPRTSLHGVLVDVDGIGVLMTGASGIGKSECALDLVLRGHRLVADDVVDIRCRGEDLVGQAADLIRDMIEIRGLGILNVAELYGVAATRDHKRIEIHVELEEWRQNRVYDRIGQSDRTRDILGIKLQSVLLPVRPGRDIAAIVEVAARNLMLQVRGHYAAEQLTERIHRNLVRSERRNLSDETLQRLQDARGATPDLRAAAKLTDVTDHIEDEVE